MNQIEDCLEKIAEVNEEALYPSDLKEAVIGMVERCGQKPLVLMSTQKCLKIFMERDGMSEDEALEYFDFNVIGSWLGEGTPCFATLVDDII